MSEHSEIMDTEQKEDLPQETPNYFFQKDEKPSTVVAPVEEDQAGKLVEQALHAGIIHKVQSDDVVKGKILDTADTVIDTQLDVVKSKADKADKKAYFEANEAACSYFGYDEQTTNKSHINLMKGWAWFFNALYIVTLGFFLVAPITFFVHKLRVVIKNNWIVLLLAVLIYAFIVLTPFFVVWLGRL